MTQLFSHSRLSSFENCPKQFQFRYVLEIPQEVEGVEAFVGKRVHEILERLYIFAGNNQVPSLDKVIARFHALWEERYDRARIRIVRSGTDETFYRHLGIRCLSNYYRAHYPFDGEETIGLEERVVFTLDEAGEYRIQGIIDRIARTSDGTIEIQDFKTGRYVPSQKRLDEDRQLALYQIGLSRRYSVKTPFRLVWHYVSRAQTRTSVRTEEQLQTLRGKTIKLIDKIGVEEEYAPKKSKLCDWCEYRDICPAFGAPADAGLRAAAAAAESRRPQPDTEMQLPLL